MGVPSSRVSMDQSTKLAEDCLVEIGIPVCGEKREFCIESGCGYPDVVFFQVASTSDSCEIGRRNAYIGFDQICTVDRDDDQIGEGVLLSSPFAVPSCSVDRDVKLGVGKPLKSDSPFRDNDDRG